MHYFELYIDCHSGGITSKISLVVLLFSPLTCIYVFHFIYILFYLILHTIIYSFVLLLRCTCIVKLE